MIKPKQNKVDNQLGKLPPQAIEAERVVLGAVLLESQSLAKVMPILTVQSFYSIAHQQIWQAISDLFSRSQPIDIITVTRQLRTNGQLETIGGAYYVTELTDRVASSANIENHAYYIEQMHIARDVIHCANEAMVSAYDPTSDVFQVVQKLSSELYQSISLKNGREAVRIDEIIVNQIKQYQQKKLNGITGVTSGFSSIDAITCGWQPSDLVIIAARPGMGKTAFTLALARNAGVPIAFFSLEMSKEQLVDRLISSETGIYQEKLKRRDLTDHDFEKLMAMAALENLQLYFDDTPALNIQAMRSKCTQLKQKHDIGLIIVDYLQLMQGDREIKGNREQEISSISRGLKALAKELNVPVIALSQLSRSVENRPAHDRRPQLSDLRESGAIEQDADQVVFLFRPEYYGITTDGQGNDLRGIAEVIFAKNRNGLLDTLELKFNGSIMQWSDDKVIEVPVPF